MIIASLGTGRYLGGVPGKSREVRGRVWGTDDGIGIGTAFPTDFLVPLVDIASVDVDTVAVAKSKVPAAVAFGVLGALTARGSENKVAITVTLTSGDLAYFRLDVLALPFAQSMVQPWLREHGLTGSAVAPTPTGAEDLVARLERLAALHAAGSLSDSEFASAKARLIAG